jgi:hypothetical protein
MKKGALLLLVAPLGLAACGGGSKAQVTRVDPVAYVKSSAQKTGGLTSEHMTLNATVSAAGQSFSMKGSGDYVNKPRQSTIDMSVSLMGHDVTFTGVQDGTVMYLRSPVLASRLPAGKNWMKLDLGKLAQSHGIDYSSLMSRSPTQALEQVEAAGSVTRMGAETIDGVDTTHYQVTKIDVSKLPQGAKLQGLANVSYGPIDVWIGNKDGYIYRESASFTVSVDGQSSSTSTQFDFSNFGEKVNVTVPPASEVFDATSLANGGLGI